MRHGQSGTSIPGNVVVVACCAVAIVAAISSWSMPFLVGGEGVISQVRPGMRKISNRDPTDGRVPDGAFNGIPMFFVDDSMPASHTHCVGDNFLNDAWKHRSCEFRNLCFDMENSTFVLINSASYESFEQELTGYTGKNRAQFSTRMKQTVSIVPVVKGKYQRPWVPAVLPSSNQYHGYYELPSNFAWIPFTGRNHTQNPGHLLWDYLLAFYRLLLIFGLEDKQMLLTFLNVKTNLTLRSAPHMTKFLPLLGVPPGSFSTHDAFNATFLGHRRSRFVCSKHGAAGIAPLSDHVSSFHGNKVSDLVQPVNPGKGPIFYSFKKWMMQNVGIEETELPSREPYRIVFAPKYESASSKGERKRLADFGKQISAVKEALGDQVQVQQYDMAKLDLRDQIRVASMTSIYVAPCGGGTMTATFMPRGGTLILYCIDDKYLDFDFWNNAGYVKAHWMPMSSMDEEEDINVLVQLIRTELDQPDTTVVN